MRYGLTEAAGRVNVVVGKPVSAWFLPVYVLRAQVEPLCPAASHAAILGADRVLVNRLVSDG